MYRVSRLLLVPVLFPPKKVIRVNVQVLMRQKHIGRWYKLERCRQNKLLPIQISRKIGEEILKQPNREQQLRTIAGLITGHCGLGKYLHCIENCAE